MWEKEHVERKWASGRQQMGVKGMGIRQVSAKRELGAKKGRDKGKAALHDMAYMMARFQYWAGSSACFIIARAASREVRWARSAIPFCSEVWGAVV